MTTKGHHYTDRTESQMLGGLNGGKDTVALSRQLPDLPSLSTQMRLTLHSRGQMERSHNRRAHPEPLKNNSEKKKQQQCFVSSPCPGAFIHLRASLNRPVKSFPFSALFRKLQASASPSFTILSSHMGWKSTPAQVLDRAVWLAYSKEGAHSQPLCTYSRRTNSMSC